MELNEFSISSKGDNMNSKSRKLIEHCLDSVDQLAIDNVN